MTIDGAASIAGGLTPNENETGILINRTGGALVAGDIVALNLDFAATSGQAMVGLDPSVDTDGAAGYIYKAAIAVTTENRFRCLAVCLSANVADNAEGLFGINGVFPCNMNGANAGEFLVGTDGQKYLTPLTLTEILALTTAATGLCGYALEATTSTQVKRARFCGETWKCFAGGDT